MSLEWVGYLSTTGVYGNTKGDWVSEINEPNPFQKRSYKRLNCEKEWIESGLPVQIFRLPGIYGCLLYTSPSPRDSFRSRMPSSA